MQDELAGTENRIAVERKRYDDAIQDYNTYIGQFPNNSSRDGPASSATTHTSRLPKRRAKRPRFNSLLL